MPSTCAPMIGNTCARRGAGGRRRSSRSASSPHHHAKLAWAASSDGITPGRRTSSRSGAARPRRRDARSGPPGEQLGDPARVGPHRDHERRARAPRTPRPPTTASRGRGRPARGPEISGLNTAGPRIAPNTAPNSTSAIRVPAALRRIHVAGRRACEQRAAARAPTADEPAEDDRRRVARRFRAPPADSRSRRPRSRPPAPGPARTGPSRARPAAPSARPTPGRSRAPGRAARARRHVTSVSDATAADSWSIPEFAASAAASSERVAADRQRARAGAQTTTFHGSTRHAVTSSAAT